MVSSDFLSVFFFGVDFNSDIFLGAVMQHPDDWLKYPQAILNIDENFSFQNDLYFNLHLQSLSSLASLHSFITSPIHSSFGIFNYLQTEKFA